MMYKKHMEIARRHYGYASFSNVYRYCCALLDSRDGLYEPVPPSLPKYLLTWLVGSLANWRHPLRFWKECLCAGLDAWKRGAWPPGGRPGAAPSSPGPVVATGSPAGCGGNEPHLPESVATVEEAPTAGSVSLPVREIWLDVGAHLGEKTFAVAQQDPRVRVYAFEPNRRVAAQRMGLLPNFVVIPMAVAEHDGSADLYLNQDDASSSLLPFNPEGLRRWIGREQLKVVSR